MNNLLYCDKKDEKKDIPPLPQLHRSVNELPRGKCINKNCKNEYPENRECKVCNECTTLFGCKCRSRLRPYNIPLK